MRKWKHFERDVRSNFTYRKAHKKSWPSIDRAWKASVPTRADSMIIIQQLFTCWAIFWSSHQLNASSVHVVHVKNLTLHDSMDIGFTGQLETCHELLCDGFLHHVRHPCTFIHNNNVINLCWKCFKARRDMKYLVKIIEQLSLQIQSWWRTRAHVSLRSKRLRQRSSLWQPKCYDEVTWAWDWAKNQYRGFLASIVWGEYVSLGHLYVILHVLYFTLLSDCLLDGNPYTAGDHDALKLRLSWRWLTYRKGTSS